MKFAGQELPKWWWLPFLGAIGLIGLGVYLTVMYTTDAWVNDADKARLAVDASGSPTLEQLDEAIRLNPGFFQAYLKRSREYLERARYDEALADADRALEITPANPEVLQLRAEIRSQRARSATTTRTSG